MGFWDFISGNASKIIDSVGNAIDKLSTTDEEKMQLKNELAKSVNTFKLEVMKAQNEYEQQLTERLRIDMTSDNKLSKNIRPFTLGFILILLAVLFITNGILGYHYDESFIELLKVWGGIVFVFYFGGRTYEKKFLNGDKK